MTRAAVLAIDGGNSKADVVLAGAGGELLAAVRSPSISHQAVGVEEGIRRLRAAVVAAADAAGVRRELPVAQLVLASVAGADYPSDIQLLTRAFEAERFAERTVVVNDTFGALRAGTSHRWGVALVCGQGVNAAAIAPNGRSLGFPAVGEFAGDWGGGTSIGMAALGAAVRARDGRGPRTALERSVPAYFGLVRPAAVTRALYDGRIASARIAELSPLTFAAACGGDPVARAIVDRLAAELATMATALIRRLHMTRLEIDVVLAGGVFRTQDGAFYAAIERGIRAVAPRATLVRLGWPPVVGAALLGLERLAGPPVDAAVEARIRREVAAWERSLG